MAEAKGTNIELRLNDVRLSFFNGFTPQEGRDDDGKLVRWNYNTNVLIPKDREDLLKMIKDAMGKVKKAQWADSPPKLGPDRLCLRDGEPADEDGVRAALYDGYAQHFYLSANKPVTLEMYDLILAGKKERPVSIIGPKKGANGKFRELNEGDEFAPYSGSFANVIVNIYAYAGDPAKKRPARINASLEAVQWKRSGDAFGNKRVDVNSAFDEEDDDEGGSPASSGSAAADEDFDIG